MLSRLTLSKWVSKESPFIVFTSHSNAYSFPTVSHILILFTHYEFFWIQNAFEKIPRFVQHNPKNPNSLYTTTYISDESLENVQKSLEKNSMLAIRWFENNYMKLNTDKCRLIVSGYKHEQVWANRERFNLGKYWC